MPKQDLPKHSDSGVDALAVFNEEGCATGSKHGSDENAAK